MSMRLMIAVPTTDYMPAGFVKSLCDLQRELNRKKISYTVEIQSGTLVYIARNRLASKAINEGYTHVLWLDSDMVFNDQVVEDLMFCGKEMVCGAFVSRRPPYGPCIYESIKKYEIEKVKEFGTKPFRVDGCGFACVLTTVELLQAVALKFGTTFQPTDYYGEDLAFCWRVGQIGREIWCEPTVRPGHIAHVPVYAGEEPFSRTEQAGEGE
ncbi:MAG: hypothetical protein J6U26_00250 [Lachnospiraceae bacterium]|jgi:hypothetical protein|nr:hypothetical protein [Lachnospiraceae bacterium]